MNGAVKNAVNSYGRQNRNIEFSESNQANSFCRQIRRSAIDNA